jgi:hypothetical protein
MRVQQETRIDCQDLAGHEQDLIVFGDRDRCVLVFPPQAWAVLIRSQVEGLRAALIIGDDGTWNAA